MHGIIFNIKKFAIHDGPGIRTTVFLKGCPLDCWWCHNPESKSPKIEYLENKKSGKKQIGQKVTVAEIVDEIRKDEIFYEQSGGGVTLSGGEPLMQPDFCREILIKCQKAGIHTTIDTSGYAPSVIFDNMMPSVDLFLFDIKAVNNRVYKNYIGKDNHQILKNLDLLLDNNCNLEIRIPLIPGITDTQENLITIRDYLIEKGINRAVALPFNSFYSDKVERFNYVDKLGKMKRQAATQLQSLKESVNNDKFNLIIN